MSEEERPLRSANITRLRVIYRDCKSEVRILEELRDELKKRRTESARELLATVQWATGYDRRHADDDINGGKPIANDAHVSDELKDNTKGPAGRRTDSSRNRCSEAYSRLAHAAP